MTIGTVVFVAILGVVARSATRKPRLGTGWEQVSAAPFQTCRPEVSWSAGGRERWFFGTQLPRLAGFCAFLWNGEQTLRSFSSDEALVPTAAWGSSPDDLWVSAWVKGQPAPRWLHHDGKSFARVGRFRALEPFEVTAAAASGPLVWLGGDEVLVGTSPTQTFARRTGAYVGAWSYGSGVWAVDNAGPLTAVRWEAGGWRERALAPKPIVQSAGVVGAPSLGVWLLPGSGFEDDRPRRVDVPAEPAPLVGYNKRAAVASSTALYVGGSEAREDGMGTIHRYDGNRWELIAQLPTEAAHLWIQAGYVFAVTAPRRDAPPVVYRRALEPGEQQQLVAVFDDGTPAPLVGAADGDAHTAVPAGGSARGDVRPDLPEFLHRGVLGRPAATLGNATVKARGGDTATLVRAGDALQLGSVRVDEVVYYVVRDRVDSIRFWAADTEFPRIVATLRDALGKPTQEDGGEPTWTTGGGTVTVYYPAKDPRVMVMVQSAGPGAEHAEGPGHAPGAEPREQATCMRLIGIGETYARSTGDEASAHEAMRLRGGIQSVAAMPLDRCLREMEKLKSTPKYGAEPLAAFDQCVSAASTISDLVDCERSLGQKFR